MKRFHVIPTQVRIHRWAPAFVGVTAEIVIPTKHRPVPDTGVGIHRWSPAFAGMTRQQR